MSGADSLDDVERELDRVVDRLMSMPLTKAPAAASDVSAAAEALLEQCRRLDPQVPADAALPALDPQGFGPLIAVLGRDWLAVASAADPEGDPDCADVLDILITLRRALP